MTEPKVLVASTVAAHCCDGMTEFRWLTHFDAWVDRGYHFFLAMQTGQGHDSKLSFLRGELDTDITLGRATVWKYSVDMGEPVVDSNSRLPGICMGRNLAHEFAVRGDYTHLMFIDTDVMPTEDGVERLLEVNWPVVGACVPSYCHFGPRLQAVDMGQWEGWGVRWKEEVISHPATGELVHFDAGYVEEYGGGDETELYLRQRTWSAPPFPADADVRLHWTTAGALLMTRECFRAVRWRTDPEAGLSDDPATILTAERLGFGPEWVRHDVVWDHEPLVALEHRGRDLSIRR